MMTGMNLPPTVTAPLTAYWLLTRRVGPKNPNDIFYGRFSVVLLSVSQLAILCAIGSKVAPDLWSEVGSDATLAAVLVATVALAVSNGILILSLDDRLRRRGYRAAVPFWSMAVVAAYFGIAFTCALQLFGKP